MYSHISVKGAINKCQRTSSMFDQPDSSARKSDKGPFFCHNFTGIAIMIDLIESR